MGPGLLDDRGKSGGVAHGQVGQDFAIEINTGLIQPMHELAVGHPVEAGGSIDAGDPEPAKIPLALTAVAVGVGLGAVDRFLSSAEEATSSAPIAFGKLEYLLFTFFSGYGMIDPWPCFISPLDALFKIQCPADINHVGGRDFAIFAEGPLSFG